MFGINVSDEVSLQLPRNCSYDRARSQVSRDLLQTPGYNPFLNQAALWMLVISPLSKFALCTRPVSFLNQCYNLANLTNL